MGLFSKLIFFKVVFESYPWLPFRLTIPVLKVGYPEEVVSLN